MTCHARMRIGNQTAKAAADPFAPYYFALEHGFDAFEWFADRKDGWGFDFSQLHPAGREALRRRGHEDDIRFSVHAPVWADPLDPDGVTALHEAIDFGDAIDARVIVFHLAAEDEPNAIAEAMRPIIDHAVTAQICLALENTPVTSPEQFNSLFEHLRNNEQAAAHVGMCFDVGHANLHPATHNDYVAYLDRLAPYVPIAHVHVHENYGDDDSHLPIGTGPAAADATGVRSLIKRLHWRGYDGSLIMEQWPDPSEMLCDARRWLQTQIDQVCCDG